ncbi:MAG: hypothetical protein JOZ69_21200 [Myxococcales bacterium]|nr:hypothetical protein [Myxococcales bacterium]
MGTARYLHSQAKLADGTVVIFGGVSADVSMGMPTAPAVAATEFYVPSSGRSSRPRAARR